MLHAALPVRFLFSSISTSSGLRCSASTPPAPCPRCPSPQPTTVAANAAAAVMPNQPPSPPKPPPPSCLTLPCVRSARPRWRPSHRVRRQPSTPPRDPAGVLRSSVGLPFPLRGSFTPSRPRADYPPSHPDSRGPGGFILRCAPRPTHRGAAPRRPSCCLTSVFSYSGGGAWVATQVQSRPNGGT